MEENKKNNKIKVFVLLGVALVSLIMIIILAVSYVIPKMTEDIFDNDNDNSTTSVKKNNKIEMNNSVVEDVNVTENNEKTEDEKPSGETKTPEKPKSKCNSGYVYVSDDKKCYNSKLTKDPVQAKCQAGYDDLGPDCGKAVDASLCDSNPDNYSKQNGKCYDNSTIYNNFPNCPKGYQYLWGEYGGQTFNGDCYRFVNPNY